MVRALLWLNRYHPQDAHKKGGGFLLSVSLAGASLLMCLVVFFRMRDSHRLLQKAKPMDCYYSSSPESNGNNAGTKGISNREHLTNEDSSSWVETLDYGSRVSCGYYKCFFPLMSSNSTTDDGKAGYLVVQDQAAKRFQTLRQSFALGSFLESSFGAHQMALQEPYMMEISEETAAKLNTNLYYDEDMEAVEERFRPGPLVIQKQRRAPRSSLIFGTTKWKRHLLFANLEDFMQGHVGIDNYSQFTKQLKHQLLLSKELIDKVRCLAFDFQVFVDRKGNFFHFDLDRCFLHSPEDEDDVLERFGRRRKELLSKVQELVEKKSSKQETK